MMKKKYKQITIGIILAVGVFFLFGIPTALIPTSLFTRMMAVELLDYILLISTSILIGIYAAITIKIKTSNKVHYSAAGSTLPAFLGFSCPICNALLVAIFGATTLIYYFEPIRHIVGVIGVAALSLIIYTKLLRRDCCN
jgi:hypothetical protein